MTTEPIEPALTAEDWANPSGIGLYDLCVRWEPDGLPKIIALANADLPDSDPRKITREKLAGLRVALSTTSRPADVYNRVGGAFLDALESYLPPE